MAGETYVYTIRVGSDILVEATFGLRDDGCLGVYTIDGNWKERLPPAKVPQILREIRVFREGWNRSVRHREEF